MEPGSDEKQVCSVTDRKTDWKSERIWELVFVAVPGGNVCEETVSKMTAIFCLDRKLGWIVKP